MWPKPSLFVIFVLHTLVVSQTMVADNGDTLQTAFASALAEITKSFSNLTNVLSPKLAATTNISSWSGECTGSAGNFSSFTTCLQQHAQTCMSLGHVRSLFNISSNHALTQEVVLDVSPALLYSLISCDAQELEELVVTSKNDSSHNKKPTPAEMWGYSFLCVTLINLSSVTGAIVLPCMKRKFYRLVLMFMVALAVGTLSGSALLFLIPEAFLLVEDESSKYIWKSTTIMGGIYLFYITEKIMRMVNARRENTKAKKLKGERATQGVITTSFRPIAIDNSLPGKDPVQAVESIGGIYSSELMNSSSSISSVTGPNGFSKDNRDDSVSVISNTGGDQEKPVANGHSHNHGHSHHPGEIAPVAYMIIFGDALHNFIDGLSIGSAFTQSILAGVSVSVAVVCEELPHELGDFAVLLNSGMKFWKAILYNFLSACTCYIGNIIGIVVAENVQAHEWIFAVAGGMFLYISLVDMMPEMNTAAESEEGKQFGEGKIFILQNAGILTGFAIMLLFALYGDNISFE